MQNNLIVLGKGLPWLAVTREEIEKAKQWANGRRLLIIAGDKEHRRRWGFAEQFTIDTSSYTESTPILTLSWYDPDHKLIEVTATLSVRGDNRLYFDCPVVGSMIVSPLTISNLKQFVQVCLTPQEWCVLTKGKPWDTYHLVGKGGVISLLPPDADDVIVLADYRKRAKERKLQDNTEAPNEGEPP